MGALEQAGSKGRARRGCWAVPAVLLVVLLLSPAPAWASFAHTRSLKTASTWAGASAVFSTTGMPTTGYRDWHEMSLTLYAPARYIYGATWHVDGRTISPWPTLAIAIGRNNGYNSTPAHNIHDDQLLAYTLSTFAPADVENNREFVYLGGREHPVTLQPNRDYGVVVQYTGLRRWIPYSAAPVRGKTAAWYDHQGHWAYRWVCRINSVQIADVWFNSPVASVKFEVNHVRPERVKSTSTFKNLRVRAAPSLPDKPMARAVSFPLDSNRGYYTSWRTPYTRTVFVLGSASLGMTRTALTPLTGSSATVSAVLRDAVSGTRLPGVPVSMYGSSDGGRTWWRVMSLTTNSSGVVGRIVSSKRPMAYRFVSMQDPLHFAATSAICTVRARDQLTLGWIPASATVGKTISVSATLLPSHSGWIRLTADHLEGGRWVQRAAPVMARHRDGKTYSASVLGLAGSWRLRAYHSQSGNATLYTPYRVTTVK